MTEIKLLDAISQQNWKLVSSLIESDNGANLSKISDENGRLPLHNLFNYARAPSELILKLIDVNKDAVKTADGDSLLPLHHACFWGASPAVIESLIRIYPLALDSTNVFGDTPRSLAKIGSLNAQSKSLVSKTTSYWVELCKLDMRGLQVRNMMKSGIVSSAKGLKDTLIEEVGETVLIMRDSAKELKDTLIEEIEQTKLIMMGENITDVDEEKKEDCEFLSKTVEVMMREIESIKKEKHDSKLCEMEKRLSILEGAYQNANRRLEQAVLDNESVIQAHNILKKKLEDKEILLDNVEAKLKQVDFNKKETEEVVVAKVMNTLEHESKTIVSSCELIEIRNDIDKLKKMLQNSDKSFDGKIAAVTKIISDAFSYKLEIELDKVKYKISTFADSKVTEEMKNDIDLLKNELTENKKYIEKELSSIHSDNETKKSEICKRLVALEGYYRDANLRLEKANLKTDEAVVKVFNKLGEHDNKFNSYDSMLNTIDNNVDDLDKMMKDSRKKVDEKIAITTRFVTERFNLKLEKELSEMKNKLATLDKNEEAIEEIKNDIVAIEVEWSARHEFLEKEVSSVAARLFDGEDWECA